MDHRIRKAMKENKGQLFGTVEVDETYRGRTGKGPCTKTNAQSRAPAVWARLLSWVFYNAMAQSSLAVISKVRTARHCTAKSTSTLNRAAKYSPTHGADTTACIHILRMKSLTMPWVMAGASYTRTASRVFGPCSSAAITGIYHQMSRKHLQRYIEEYTFRFNRRTELMQSVWSDVVENMSNGTRLPYKELTA